MPYNEPIGPTTEPVRLQFGKSQGIFGINVAKGLDEASDIEQAMQDMAFNQSMMYANNQGGSNTGSQGGAWYFYNLNAKSFGQPEFRMKWGERVLEDNWRRSNKRTLSQISQVEGSEADSLGNIVVVWQRTVGRRHKP